MEKLKVYLSRSNQAASTVVASVERQLQLLDFVQIFKYSSASYSEDDLANADLVVVVPPRCTKYGRVTIGKGIYNQIKLALKAKKPVLICNYGDDRHYEFCANSIRLDSEVDESDWVVYGDLSFSHKQTITLEDAAKAIYNKRKSNMYDFETSPIKGSIGSIGSSPKSTKEEWDRLLAIQREKRKGIFYYEEVGDYKLENDLMLLLI